MRLGDAAELLGRRDEEPVVGPDVHATLTVAQRECAPHTADAGIDDRKMDTRGHERQRVRERQRALQDALRGNAVRDVDDLHLRRDALDDAVARADEVVLQSEVGQERNEARHAAAESTSPSTSCDWASATISTPAPRAAAVVCGPIDTGGPPPPARA